MGSGRSRSKRPVHLTSFIGREAELHAIDTLLREQRLITLTGAGGSGKTRLAALVAVAADGRTDGTHWVDLAPLTDPALVPATVAAGLGMSEPPEPITDAVVRHLADRAALLVLDNCEHLVAACASMTARIVEECPSVTVLATSRELLGIVGETRWPVPPLSLPSDEDPAACESVRLFVDRARSASPTFGLTPANAAAVAEICRRLDGIPLAIELAAARIRVLSVEQIANGLEDRFHLLSGATRGALPRQRTLEGSVSWSHDLLDERARAVFRRLGTFVGSFTLDAAEAVCSGGDIPASGVLDLLSALVDRSLVQVVDEAGPRTRYRLLETIRDYARQRLSDVGEAEAAHERHLAWCLALAARAEAGLEGDDPLTSLTLVDSEIDNIRAALDWSARTVDADAGVRLVGRLLIYWFVRGELAVGRGRLEAALARGTDDTARANSLAALCMVAYRVGDMAEAARYGDDAVTVARGTADHRAAGRALHFRAWVRFWGMQDRFGSWSDFEDAGDHLRAGGDDAFIALNQAVLGWSYIDTSRAPMARSLLDDALERAAVTSPARAQALFALGWLDELEGRDAEADQNFDAAVCLARAIGDHYLEAITMSLQARRLIDQARFDEARPLCDSGLELARHHRVPICEASMRGARASLLVAEGDIDSANAELQRAIERTPMPWFRAFLLVAHAGLALAEEQDPTARARAEEALALGREHDSIGATSGALMMLATLAQREGDVARAEAMLQEALDVACAAGWTLLVAAILDELAALAAARGRFEESARLFGAASTAERDMARSFFLLIEREAILRTTRDALGEKFEALWAQGAATSVEDAAKYALRGRGRRKRPSSGWGSLTPAERSVVDLVAEGLTNPQIGERLFVSPRTVQAHLARVFAKLHVATRAELAAAAVRSSSTTATDRP